MRRILALVLAGSALAAPASALAQDATQGYKPVSNVLGEIGEVGGNEPQAQPAPTQAAPAPAAPVAVQNAPSGDSLPFTGADVGIVAGLGVLLLIAGFGLRRVRTN